MQRNKSFATAVAFSAQVGCALLRSFDLCTMAPKRVVKVASKAALVAPLASKNEYPRGNAKVKWIHYAPQHSKKRPWRIQITGHPCLF